jgi:phenylalanyl-tRNA synthetase alpha chain
MNNELQKIKEEVIGRIKKISKEIDINNLETKYLGRKGELTKILRNLKNLGEEQKKEMGRLANQIKEEIKGQIEEKREEISGNFSSKDIDVSLPGPKTEIGHLNPLSIVQNELEELFISMGFMVLDGPELESDYYCFEALNIPKNHPARDMQDTFYIDKKNEEGE